MTEKRYKSYKYVDCYCAKHNQIQVGVDGYKYLTPIGMVGGPVLTFMALIAPVDILTKLTAIFLLGLPAIGAPLYNYHDTKKIMLEAGHSEICSRKIAVMYMFRAALYSEFKIMTTKDDGKRWWR